MTYLGRREALEAQKSELESRLAELRARLVANKQTESETLATVRSLEEPYARPRSSSQRAGERPAQRALPIFHLVSIFLPCAVPLESLTLSPP